LLFAAGPLTNGIFPIAGMLKVISKSPLTVIHDDANARGYSTPELKCSGFDMIVFDGRSPKPV
jgi:aldehyde:ferredoxin oxidoreductase